MEVVTIHSIGVSQHYDPFIHDRLGVGRSSDTAVPGDAAFDGDQRRGALAMQWFPWRFPRGLTMNLMGFDGDFMVISI